MTTVLDGPRDEGFDLIGANANVCEGRGDLKVAIEFFKPRKKAFGGIGLEAGSDGQTREAFGRDREIESHARGHQDGIGEAMMEIADGGQGMSAGVGDTEAFLKSDSAHACGFEEGLAALDIKSVFFGRKGFLGVDATCERDDRKEVLSDDPDAFESDAIGEGMMALGEKGFDEVREGIHPGGGGDRGRKFEGKLGVEDGEGGHHPGVEDDALAVGVVFGNDGRTAYFAACPGGGGEGDEPRERLIDRTSIGAAIFVIKQIAGVMDKQADDLGDIKGGPASEGDDRIGVGGPISANAFFDLRFDRIAPDPGEDGGFEAFFSKDLGKVFGDRQGSDPSVGDDQRTRQALGFESGGKAATSAGARQDLGWIIELMDRHRQDAPKGRHKGASSDGAGGCRRERGRRGSG